MKAIFIVGSLCLLGSIALAQPTDNISIAKTFEIGGIRVEGCQLTDPEALITLSGLRVGDKIQLPGIQTAQAVEALWKLQLLKDVQIYEDRREDHLIFLTIIVTEANRVGRFRLRGLKKEWKKQLEEDIENQLPLGTAYTGHLQNSIREIISAYCAEKGFASATVDMALIYDSTSLEYVLDLEVDCGARWKIHQIKFSGNQKVKSSKLRRLMENTKERAHLWSRSRFVERAYREDLDRIVEYYHSMGYLDAAVSRDTFWWDAEGLLHLNVQLSEGELYYIRSLKWEGNSIYSDRLLSKILGFEKGDVYRPQQINQNLHFHPEGKDVSSLYLDYGHLLFRADLVEKSLIGDSIDLEIRILEGPLATIGRVTISGNDRTKDYVIRRELDTRPGQPFSRAAIIRSQRRLMNMGYFDPSAFDVRTEVHPEEGTVDIEYVLKERSADKFELAGGWDPGSNQVFGTVGVSFRNFAFSDLFRKGSWRPYPQGNGQQLSFRVQSSGLDFQSYNISFTEPWLNGKPRSLTVAGFLTRRNETLAEGTDAHYSVFGGVVDYGARVRFWDDYLVSNTSVNFQRIQLENWELADFALEDGTPLSNGSFHNFFLKQSLTYTNLNHPFFPTKGNFFSLSVQLTPPYSLFRKNNSTEPSQSFKWLEYHKWRLEATKYFPITQRMTLRATAKAGYLGGYGQAVSPFERFQLGGDGLNRLNGYTGVDVIALRGYDEERDFAINQKGNATLFNKYTMELRYLLLDQPASSAYVHAFAEAGNAWQGTDNYNPFDLKRSVGIGFRVNVPMIGLIGVDYGLGFDKTANGSGNFLSRFGKLSLVIGIEPD